MFALEVLWFECLSASVCRKPAQIQALQRTSQATYWSICSFSGGIQIHTKGISFWLLFTISFWPNQIWLILTQHLTTATHNFLTSSNKGIFQVLQKDRALKYFCKLHKYTIVHSQPWLFYICNIWRIFNWMKTQTHSHQSLEVLLSKANGIKYSLKKENWIRRG